MPTLVHTMFTQPELSGFSIFFDVLVATHMTAYDVSMAS